MAFPRLSIGFALVSLTAGFAMAGSEGEQGFISLDRPVKVLTPSLSTAIARGGLAQMEVSGSGRYLAAATKYYLNVWDVRTGEHVRYLPSDHVYRRVLFSSADELLVDDGKQVMLHPLPKGEPKPLALKGSLLEFTPDGKTLLTAEEKALVLWDWPACTRRAAISLPSTTVSTAIDPAGKTAVIVLNAAKPALIDFGAGRVRDVLPVQFQTSSRVAGFCPAGHLVIGVTAESVEAWNPLTGTRVRRFDSMAAKDIFGIFQQFRALAVAAAGRRAAATNVDGDVRIYETVTGQVLLKFRASREPNAIALSPDGNQVFAGNGEQHILVWDISPSRLPAKSEPLSEEVLSKAFDDLGTQRAEEALKTLALLQANADQSVAFLAKKLRPVAPVDGRVLDQLFQDLDGASFAARATADRQLRTLSPAAIAGIRERAARPMSLEMKLRVQKILEYADGPNPERVRFARALDVLAAVNTPQARNLVAHLTTGVPGAWETEAARRALGEMDAKAGRK